ncbi:MAG: hypothetical protein EPO68_12430 [Planctomycetota bacterium]|nr:MAG: hypothetical protein EPO68_12430 [Planctomycetota bacterium]
MPVFQLGTFAAREHPSPRALPFCPHIGVLPMAKRAANVTAEKKRVRRTAEQIIADLQAEIVRVQARAAAKQMKQSPTSKCLLNAIRAIDAGLATDEEGAGALKHALADARKPLAAYCDSNGLKLPKPRLPRGRRPNA